MPDAHDGVHRVIRTAAVHADPAEFLIPHPLDEVQRRAGMAEHIAALIRRRAVPTVDVVAGVDDEYIAFLDGHALLDVLRGIDAEIFRLIA